MTGRDPLARLVGRRTQKALGALRRVPVYPSFGRYGLAAYDDPPLLWFIVPKTATRTVIAQLEANGLTHVRGRTAMRYPPNRFSQHFAFSFVRNPWDRLVSCWSGRVVQENLQTMFGVDEALRQRLMDFPTFVEWVAGQDLERGDPHLRTQSGMIDLNRVDFVGRFEHLTDDLAHVMERAGLRFDPSLHENKSSREKDYRVYYDDRTAETVGAIYAKDVKVFGYSFD